MDGTANKGDIATVNIEGRAYRYIVVDGDTLASIRDHLIDAINQDPQVEAYAAGSFTRIRLRAKVEGPDGNGIRIAASSEDGNQVIMTATNSALCCANVRGALVSTENPAVPGETIAVYATGLGMPILERPATRLAVKNGIHTGYKYHGPCRSGQQSRRNSSRRSPAAKPPTCWRRRVEAGAVGQVHQVELELNSDIPTNPYTELTIAQDIYVSNIVTFPMVNPNPPAQ